MAISTIGTNGLDQTNNIELGATGNVGIGTSSPSTYGGAKFTVLGTQPQVSVVGTSGSASQLFLLSNGNTSSSNAFLFGQGYNTGTDNIAYVSNNANADMIFRTNATERMRIDTGGSALVGCTVTPSASVAGTLLGNQQSNSSLISSTGSYTGGSDRIVFINGNGTVGKISVSGTTTTYATSSDYRLKENVQPMTGALNTIAQLKPVTYNWIIDKSKGQGFIAHELQAVVPDCVTGEKDAVDADGNPIYQGIDTSFLVATLTAAIKEQQEIIKQLQADVAKLKGAKA